MKNKIVTIDGKAGEYTGFSGPTATHNFSMYDGSVIRLSELQTIKLFGVDFVKHWNQAVKINGWTYFYNHETKKLYLDDMITEVPQNHMTENEKQQLDNWLKYGPKF